MREYCQASARFNVSGISPVGHLLRRQRNAYMWARRGQHRKVEPVWDQLLNAPAQRLGSKPAPEIWIAPGQMLRIFLERLT